MTAAARPIAGSLGFVLQRLQGVQRAGQEWKARCPAHEDRSPSLSVREGNVHPVVFHCHAGCTEAAILGAMGLTWADVCAERAPGPRSALGDLVATYDYVDASGQLLYQTCRYTPKTFRQRRPDGRGGWEWALRDARRVLYRLPEVLAAIAANRTVYVVEGEKDADSLAALGLAATTNVGGAEQGAGRKWLPTYTDALRGGRVVVLPDADEPGHTHAAYVAAQLRGIAASVRVLNLPGLPPKGDVSDWLAAGGSADQLRELTLRTPEWGQDDGADFTVDAAEGSGAGFSDDALALGFADRAVSGLRYVAGTGKWLRFDSGTWREDRKLQVFDDVRGFVRSQIEEAGDVLTERVQDQLRSAKTVAAVAQLARVDQRIAAVVEQFDADPFLLNTPTGAIDLRTGVARAHRREDYCTKQTAVGPAPDASSACPRWLAFLARITGGDERLVEFLQKVAGYCLTGSIDEHAIFFCYGTGGNGKGVFLNTLTRILGEYAKVAPIETFTASTSDRHPTELAMLRGARLVAAQETEEGRRWAEAKIKAISGGDPVTARFMRGDFFTYEPQFKLVIAGNHRPHLRSVDEAIRRRFHLIPFEQTIPAAERDASLPEKLCAEWPGILGWAIEGCALWLQEGLRPPAAVQDATNAYFTAEDSFQAWVDDCCRTGSNAWAASGELFASWKGWAERAGEVPGTAKRFAMTLQARGFSPRRGHGGVRGFDGITVRQNSAEAFRNAS